VGASVAWRHEAAASLRLTYYATAPTGMILGNSECYRKLREGVLCGLFCLPCYLLLLYSLAICWVFCWLCSRQLNVPYFAECVLLYSKCPILLTMCSSNKCATFCSLCFLICSLRSLCSACCLLLSLLSAACHPLSCLMCSILLTATICPTMLPSALNLLWIHKHV